MRSIVAIGLFGLLLLILPGAHFLFAILDSPPPHYFPTELSSEIPDLSHTDILFLCLLGSTLIFFCGMYLIHLRLNAPIRSLTEDIHHSEPTLSYAFTDVKQLEQAVKLHHARLKTEGVSTIEALESRLMELQRNQHLLNDLLNDILNQEATPLKAQIEYINSISLLLTPSLQSWKHYLENGTRESSARLTATLEFLIGEMTNAQPDTRVTIAPLLELTDETLDILAPLLQSSQTRVHILFDSPTQVTCNATRLKQLLFMILLSSLHSRPEEVLQERSMSVTVSYSNGLLCFRFMEDLGQLTGLSCHARFKDLLADSKVAWNNQCLTVAATHPQNKNSIPGDSGLTAMILSDNIQERKSLQQRLHTLGVTTTVDFNTHKIDLCLVSGKKYSMLPAITPSLQDSTCIVTLHRKAENIVNKNAFHIPLDYPISQAKLASIIREIEHRKHQKQARQSVLVVDDSPLSLQQPERLLTELGHEVTSVSSGHQAITAFESDQFQLVLMDIQMPELDGVETTRLIRRLDTKTPIIGLTAHATDEERQGYLAAGMNDVLIKPLDKASLRLIFKQEDTLTSLVAAKPPLATTSSSRLAIFDAELALSRANGKPDLVQELMALFIKGLPEDQGAIRAATGDPVQLKRSLHKLRGAVSYCGVPRLARAIESLEIELKDNKAEQVTPLLALLHREIETLIDWYERNHGELGLENKIA